MGLFLEKLRQAEDKLDLCLPEFGRKQIKGKQEVAVWLEGEGALACTRWLRGPGRALLPGSLKEEV
eukprot:4407715-Pyramimonas_sp.AAC.1